MRKEFILALVMVFSWTAATMFTDGVETVADSYMSEKHHKAVIYFLLAIIFIIIVSMLSDHSSL